MPRFKVGDVVYADGASLILGDVTDVSEDEDYEAVTVKWRVAESVEDADDLQHSDGRP